VKLGKVIGVVWATQKVPEISGCRLYLVQPVNAAGEKYQTPLVVADPESLAAPGDKIVYVTILTLLRPLSQDSLR